MAAAHSSNPSKYTLKETTDDKKDWELLRMTMRNDKSLSIEERMKKFYHVLSRGAEKFEDEAGEAAESEAKQPEATIEEEEEPQTPLPMRAIIHLDVDCFECQVWLTEFEDDWRKRPIVTINPPQR